MIFTRYFSTLLLRKLAAGVLVATEGAVTGCAKQHNTTEDQMAEVEWVRLKAHELRRLAKQDAIVVMPVASIEQHGPHLPVQTDSLIAYETSCRAARLVAKTEPIVVLPTVWSGLSPHHMPFGGTITVRSSTFFALLRDIVDSLRSQGFRRICFNNGHGGNITALKMAAQDLALEFSLPIVAATYCMEAVQAFGEILEDQTFVMHSGEAETSIMMALAPDQIDGSDLAGVARPVTGAGLAGPAATSYRWQSFASRSSNGVVGDPTRASAAKGERLLQAATEGMVALLTDPKTWATAPDLRLPETGGVPLADNPVTP